MKKNLYDTIAAIATPAGEGGISVIRVSGGNAFASLGEIFYKDKGRKLSFNAEAVLSHTITSGTFLTAGICWTKCSCQFLKTQIHIPVRIL